ncbi:MAG: hypothetical protein B7C24_17375 [Bacteroidetes bacterium 4572_77]|nr:MAG: hypothetical protein B7C24_17375 [Bacteroidetes bacterium 4572_77]
MLHTYRNQKLYTYKKTIIMKKTDGFESTRDVEEEIKRLLEKEDKSKIKFGKGKRKVEAEGNAATILAG